MHNSPPGFLGYFIQGNLYKKLFSIYFMIVGIINQNSDISIMKHRKYLHSYKVHGIWHISLEKQALNPTLVPLNGGLDCLFGGFKQNKIGLT